VTEGSRPPYLRVRGVAKRFGSFEALRDIDLDVAEGEFVAFLGPSGCGKTTLLRAVAGLDVQSEGTIEQAGRDISALPVGRRDFGIVFQSYALFPNLTVRDNVAYGLVSTGLRRDAVEARARELLELVGLPEQAAKYPAQLSGGQQQRVALARALALRPGLLLLDEPLSALDARVRARLRGELRALQRRLGVTTIMVTHDQEEALTMADRIVVMRAGRIEQVGTPLEVYASPATPFVAGFVGKMNFLPGRLLGPGRAEVGGAVLELDGRADGLAPGADLTVCLRPEDVVVRGVAAGGGGGRPNVLDAEVEAVEFVGNHVAASLRARGGALAVTADLSLNDVRDLGIAPGRGLAVALPPERLRVFPGAHAGA
jgi:iron(III) transport system ATP-binding protein